MGRCGMAGSRGRGRGVAPPIAPFSGRAPSIGRCHHDAGRGRGSICGVPWAVTAPRGISRANSTLRSLAPVQFTNLAHPDFFGPAHSLVRPHGVAPEQHAVFTDRIRAQNANMHGSVWEHQFDTGPSCSFISRPLNVFAFEDICYFSGCLSSEYAKDHGIEVDFIVHPTLTGMCFRQRDEFELAQRFVPEQTDDFCCFLERKLGTLFGNALLIPQVHTLEQARRQASSIAVAYAYQERAGQVDVIFAHVQNVAIQRVDSLCCTGARFHCEYTVELLWDICPLQILKLCPFGLNINTNGVMTRLGVQWCRYATGI